MFDLIDAGDAAALRERLVNEPDAASAHDEQGLTVLMRAAYRGGDVFDAVREANPALEPFDRIMVGEAEDIPAPGAWSPDGFTPLHLAAFAHNDEAARRLLEAGADPNAVSKASFARVTPLGTCAFAGATEVARVLLEHGADPTISEDGTFTPLDAAVESGHQELAALLREHMP